MEKAEDNKNYSDMTNEEYRKEINHLVQDIENNRLLQYLHRYIIGKIKRIN